MLFLSNEENVLFPMYPRILDKIYRFDKEKQNLRTIQGFSLRQINKIITYFIESFRTL